MKRTIIGILVVAAAACDTGRVLDPDFGHDAEFREESADLEIYSWVDGSDRIRSRVHCPSYTQTASGCQCDSGLTGMVVQNECAIQGCGVMHTGSTCTLQVSDDVTLQFGDADVANYTYVGSGLQRIGPNEIWTLSTTGNDSCECDACSESCTCAPGYLDFAVTMPNLGTPRVMLAEPDPKIQLNTGSCDN